MSDQKIVIDPMVSNQSTALSRSMSVVNDSKDIKTDTNDSADSFNPIASALSHEPIEADAVEEADQGIKDDDDPQKVIQDAKKEGIKEAIKESVKEHRKNTFKFYSLLNKSEKLVYRIKNIIPILRGEILIDTSKVTLIHRPFFFSERIHSIAIKDISDVFIETAPFFGSVNIVDTNFTESVVRQKWFWKKDAEKARRIITGLMAAAREHVDLKNIEDNYLPEKLEEIGKLRETSTSVSGA